VRALRHGRPGLPAIAAAAALLLVPRGAPDALSRCLAGWRRTCQGTREAA
jgi:hypothetical protein